MTFTLSVMKCREDVQLYFQGLIDSFCKLLLFIIIKGKKQEKCINAIVSKFQGSEFICTVLHSPTFIGFFFLGEE